MSAVIAGLLERIAAALEELVHRLKEKENLPPTPYKRKRKQRKQPYPARAYVREGGPAAGKVAASQKFFSP